MHTTFLPRASVALAAILFGTSGTIASMAPTQTSALTLGTWRVAIGAFGLIVVARVKPNDLRGLRPHITWVIVGGLCVAGAQLAFFESIQRVGVVVGTTITIATGPAAAAVISFAFERERPKRRWAVGASIAGSGVVVLGGASLADPLGIMFAVVSGSTFPMYGYAAKRLMATVSSNVAIATVFTVGGSILLLASPGSLSALRDPTHAAVAGAIGVVTVSIAYPLWALGLRSLNVGDVALITLMEPATAALLGVTLVGEPMTRELALGSVLIVTGIAVSSSTANDRSHRLGRPAHSNAFPGSTVASHNVPAIRTNHLERPDMTITHASHRMHRTSPRSVSLDPAVCGFPGVQLGGHVAAALLQDQSGTVQFHSPVKPHADVRLTDEGLVDANGRLLVSGRPGATDITTRVPVGSHEAAFADRTMVDRQPIPSCFACGRVRAGRGLGIRPGAIHDLGLAADIWVPPLGEADEDGIIPIGSVWSALDCAGFWSLIIRPPADANFVTGQLDAINVSEVWAGREHVITAWPHDRDTQLRVTALLHDSAGRLCAAVSQQLVAAPWGFPRSAVTDSATDEAIDPSTGRRSPS